MSSELVALNQGIDRILAAHRATTCKATGTWTIKKKSLDSLVDALPQWLHCNYNGGTVRLEHTCEGFLWLHVDVSKKLFLSFALQVLP